MNKEKQPGPNLSKLAAHEQLPKNNKRLWFGAGASLFLLSLFILLGQPRWLFSALGYLSPGVLYAVNCPKVSHSTPKIIALTIDDGPSPDTADILAVLDHYNVQATFFNISTHLPGHEATLEQMVSVGHELGNHLTADEPSIRLGPQAFEADLLTAEATWLSYLAAAPDAETSDSRLIWLRPGMGFYNRRMAETAQAHGYQLVLGSNFPYDTHLPSADFASGFIVRTAQPGDIIVLHDSKGRGQRTVQTLEKILPALQTQDYAVTTLTALTEACTY